MYKEITVSRTEIKTFKAKIKATKPHYVNKAIIHRWPIEDGINPSFKTYLTAFIPKMTMEQPKPVCMFHVSNGGGSCLFRSKSPICLAQELEHMAEILRSDIWLDMFEHMQDISGNLAEGERTPIEDKYFDLVTVKKAVGLEETEPIAPFIKVLK